MAKSVTTKWVRLGDYIEQCDERNVADKYVIDDVIGISNQKTLIPTKADTLYLQRQTETEIEMVNLQ